MAAPRVITSMMAPLARELPEWVLTTPGQVSLGGGHTCTLCYEERADEGRFSTPG
jgi:hypothetical protein